MGEPSKKPLSTKLGLKPGYTIHIRNSPDRYEKLFDQLPTPLSFVKKINKELDFIHLFIKSRQDLEEQYQALYKALKKEGLLWISWPKGTSGIKTDLNRDWIRSYVLDNGLVDVKVCSINEQWSALKFVYRVKDRK